MFGTYFGEETIGFCNKNDVGVTFSRFVDACVKFPGRLDRGFAV